ncbi:MAG: cytochrome c [Cyclobacteriaceae bacterium]|nr:cytochrome c [Cyclobacteriaceae bacterium]
MQHYSTKALLFVLATAFAIYSSWIYTKPHPDRGVAADTVLLGKRVWQENNCTACHQIFGLGGYLGPDLTNIHSTPGKGPVYIRAFVMGGTQTMPSFKLSEPEMQALIAYFRHIDAAGKADPNTYIVHPNGTIEPQ